jgi:hypothetical protein
MTFAAFLGVMMFTLLISIAVLHIAWGFGLIWPAGSEKQLVDWVVDRKGKQTMPSLWLSAVNGIGIALFAFVALMLGRAIVAPFSDRWVEMLGMLIAFALAGRTVGGYFPSWRRNYASRSFANFDNYSFAPLSLVLTIGFVVLVILRVIQ